MAFSVSTVFSIGGAVARLLDGNPPGVTLGTLTFDNIEAPEKIQSGGSQQLVVHKYPGGSRTIDAMGADDRDIQFQGFLLGPTAWDRAQELDGMRSEGGVQTLTWADQSRDVVIKDVAIDYQYAGNWIPYSVTCLIVPREDDEEEPKERTLGQRISDALGLGALSGPLAQAQQYLQKAQSILPIVGAISPKLAATAGGILASANGVASGAASVASGNLAGLATVASAGTLGVRQVMSNNAAQVSASGALAAASAVSGYIGAARAVTNSIAKG